jgi:hypothetical protein
MLHLLRYTGSNRLPSAGSGGEGLKKFPEGMADEQPLPGRDPDKNLPFYAILIPAGKITLLTAHRGVRRLLGGWSSSSIKFCRLIPIEQVLLATDSVF